MKIKKGNVEFYIAILFVTRNIIAYILNRNNGNYDLLYFVSILLIPYLLFRDKKIIKNSVISLCPFGIMALAEYILLDRYMDLTKVGIFLIKVYLCLIILFVVKKYYKYVKIEKIIRNVTIMYLLLTIVALICPNSTLWVHNDIVNKFSTTRLKLLYLEPTYLALSIAIILLYLFYWQINKNLLDSKILLQFTILFMVMMLSAGMGGIGAVLIATLTIVILKFFKDILNYKISLWIIFLTLFGTIGICFLLINQTPIVERIFAVFRGEDSSVNYRLVKGMRGMVNFLRETNGVGIGMGNMNTEKVLDMLSYWKIETVLVSSIMYFISENGIIGIMYVLVFTLYLLYKARKNILNVAIVVLCLSYQIAGGYFTDPIMWACYGIVLADNKLLDKKITILGEVVNENSNSI